MAKQIISINLLDKNSIKNAQKEIEKLKTKIQAIIPLFIQKSLDWLRDRASENISVNYPDFLTDFQTQITNNIGTLMATEERMTYIEFGTGIVGEQNQHELASELGYQYDLNKHGEQGWSFVQENSKLDVKPANIISDKENNGNRWIETKGNEAERFMWNAYFDYFEKGEYARILKEIWDSL